MFYQKSQCSKLKLLLLASVTLLLTACGGVSIDGNSSGNNTEEKDASEQTENAEQTDSDVDSSGTVTLTFVDWNTELPVTGLSVKRNSDGAVQVTDDKGQAAFSKTDAGTEFLITSPEVKYGQRQLEYDPDMNRYKVIPSGQLKIGDGSHKVSSTVTDRSTGQPVENVVAYLYLEGHDPSPPFKQANYKVLTDANGRFEFLGIPAINGQFFVGTEVIHGDYPTAGFEANSDHNYPKEDLAVNFVDPSWRNKLYPLVDNTKIKACFKDSTNNVFSNPVRMEVHRYNNVTVNESNRLGWISASFDLKPDPNNASQLVLDTSENLSYNRDSGCVTVERLAGSQYDPAYYFFHFSGIDEEGQEKPYYGSEIVSHSIKAISGQTTDLGSFKLSSTFITSSSN